jgi:L-ascorbate metabolism protein UlaG (beta-lactamase superfamily)
LITVLVCVAGCSLVSMTRSSRRDPVPQSAQLSEQVRLTSTGAINIYVFAVVDHIDLLPASVRIETPRHTIYIDPVLVDEAKPADYILITHAHGDHLSLADIDKLSGPQTLIICPATVAKELGERRHRMVKPGDSMDLEGLGVEAIAAYSTRSSFLGMSSHPRADANVGYVMTVEGVRVYDAGDTDRVPELADLKKIDVALLPIGAGDLTMSTQDAAQLVNAIKPRIVIPVHYPLATDDVAVFRTLVDPTIDVAVLQQR